ICRSLSRVNFSVPSVLIGILNPHYPSSGCLILYVNTHPKRCTASSARYSRRGRRLSFLWIGSTWRKAVLTTNSSRITIVGSQTASSSTAAYLRTSHDVMGVNKKRVFTLWHDRFQNLLTNGSQKF